MGGRGLQPSSDPWRVRGGPGAEFADEALALAIDDLAVTLGQRAGILVGLWGAAAAALGRVMGGGALRRGGVGGRSGGGGGEGGGSAGTLSPAELQHLVLAARPRAHLAAASPLGAPGARRRTGLVALAQPGVAAAAGTAGIRVVASRPGRRKEGAVRGAAPWCAFALPAPNAAALRSRPPALRVFRVTDLAWATFPAAAGGDGAAAHAQRTRLLLLACTSDGGVAIFEPPEARRRGVNARGVDAPLPAIASFSSGATEGSSRGGSGGAAHPSGATGDEADRPVAVVAALPAASGAPCELPPSSTSLEALVLFYDAALMLARLPVPEAGTAWDGGGPAPPPTPLRTCGRWQRDLRQWHDATTALTLAPGRGACGGTVAVVAGTGPGGQGASSVSVWALTPGASGALALDIRHHLVLAPAPRALPTTISSPGGESDEEDNDLGKDDASMDRCFIPPPPAAGASSLRMESLGLTWREATSSRLAKGAFVACPPIQINAMGVSGGMVLLTLLDVRGRLRVLSLVNDVLTCVASFAPGDFLDSLNHEDSRSFQFQGRCTAVTAWTLAPPSLQEQEQLGSAWMRSDHEGVLSVLTSQGHLMVLQVCAKLDADETAVRFRTLGEAHLPPVAAVAAAHGIVGDEKAASSALKLPPARLWVLSADAGDSATVARRDRSKRGCRLGWLEPVEAIAAVDAAVAALDFDGALKLCDRMALPRDVSLGVHREKWHGLFKVSNTDDARITTAAVDDTLGQILFVVTSGRVGRVPVSSSSASLRDCAEGDNDSGNADLTLRWCLWASWEAFLRCGACELPQTVEHVIALGLAAVDVALGSPAGSGGAARGDDWRLELASLRRGLLHRSRYLETARCAAKVWEPAMLPPAARAAATVIASREAVNHEVALVMGLFRGFVAPPRVGSTRRIGHAANKPWNATGALAVAACAATCGSPRALHVLLMRHPRATMPWRLALLSSLPETVPPMQYQFLLPAVCPDDVGPALRSRGSGSGALRPRAVFWHLRSATVAPMEVEWDVPEIDRDWSSSIISTATAREYLGRARAALDHGSSERGGGGSAAGLDDVLSEDKHHMTTTGAVRRNLDEVGASALEQLAATLLQELADFSSEHSEVIRSNPGGTDQGTSSATLVPAAATQCTREAVAEWFVRRAMELDSVAGMSSHAAELLALAVPRVSAKNASPPRRHEAQAAAAQEDSADSRDDSGDKESAPGRPGALEEKKSVPSVTTGEGKEPLVNSVSAGPWEARLREMDAAAGHFDRLMKAGLLPPFHSMGAWLSLDARAKSDLVVSALADAWTRAVMGSTSDSGADAVSHEGVPQFGAYDGLSGADASLTCADDTDEALAMLILPMMRGSLRISAKALVVPRPAVDVDTSTDLAPDVNLKRTDKEDAEDWSWALAHALLDRVNAACLAVQNPKRNPSQEERAAAEGAVRLCAAVVHISKPGAKVAAAGVDGSLSPRSKLRVATDSRLIQHDAPFLELVLGTAYAGLTGSGAFREKSSFLENDGIFFGGGNCGMVACAPTLEAASELFECTPARNVALEAARPDLAELQDRVDALERHLRTAELTLPYLREGLPLCALRAADAADGATALALLQRSSSADTSNDELARASSVGVSASPFTCVVVHRVCVTRVEAVVGSLETPDVDAFVRSSSAGSASWTSFVRDLEELTGILGEIPSSSSPGGAASEGSASKDLRKWALSHLLDVLLTTRRSGDDTDGASAQANDDEDADGDEDSAVMTILAAINSQKRETSPGPAFSTAHDQGTSKTTSSDSLAAAGSAEAMVIARARALMDGAEGPASGRLQEAATCLSSLSWSSSQLEAERKLLRACNYLVTLGFTCSWPSGLCETETQSLKSGKSCVKSGKFPLRAEDDGGVALRVVAAALFDNPACYRQATSSRLRGLFSASPAKVEPGRHQDVGSTLLEVATLLGARHLALVAVKVLIAETALANGDLDSALHLCTVAALEVNQDKRNASGLTSQQCEHFLGHVSLAVISEDASKHCDETDSLLDVLARQKLLAEAVLLRLSTAATWDAETDDDARNGLVSALLTHWSRLSCSDSSKTRKASTRTKLSFDDAPSSSLTNEDAPTTEIRTALHQHLMQVWHCDEGTFGATVSELKSDENSLLVALATDCMSRLSRQEAPSGKSVLFQAEFESALALGCLFSLSSPREAVKILDGATLGFDGLDDSEQVFWDPIGDADDDGDGDNEGEAEDMWVEPSPVLVEQLQQMGFEYNGARRTAAATKNAPLEVSLQWAITHANDPDFNIPLVKKTGEQSDHRRLRVPGRPRGANRVGGVGSSAQLSLLVSDVALRFLATTLITQPLSSREALLQGQAVFGKKLPELILDAARKGPHASSSVRAEEEYEVERKRCWNSLRLHFGRKQRALGHRASWSRLDTLTVAAFESHPASDDRDATSGGDSRTDATPVTAVLLDDSVEAAQHASIACLATKCLKRTKKMGLAESVVSAAAAALALPLLHPKRIATAVHVACCIPDRRALDDALKLSEFGRGRLASDEQERLRGDMDSVSPLGSDAAIGSSSIFVDDWRLVATHLLNMLSEKNISSLSRNAGTSEAAVIALMASQIRESAKGGKKAPESIVTLLLKSAPPQRTETFLLECLQATSGSRLALLELLCRLLVDVGGARTASDADSQNQSDALKQHALLLRRLLGIDSCGGLDGCVDYFKLVDCSAFFKEDAHFRKGSACELETSAALWVSKIIFQQATQATFKPIGPCSWQGAADADGFVSEDSMFMDGLTAAWLSSSEDAAAAQARAIKLARLAHHFRASEDGRPQSMSSVLRIFLQHVWYQASRDQRRRQVSGVSASFSSLDEDSLALCTSVYFAPIASKLSPHDMWVLLRDTIFHNDCYATFSQRRALAILASKQCVAKTKEASPELLLVNLSKSFFTAITDVNKEFRAVESGPAATELMEALEVVSPTDLSRPMSMDPTPGEIITLPLPDEAPWTAHTSANEAVATLERTVAQRCEVLLRSQVPPKIVASLLRIFKAEIQGSNPAPSNPIDDLLTLLSRDFKTTEATTLAVQECLAVDKRAEAEKLAAEAAALAKQERLAAEARAEEQRRVEAEKLAAEAAALAEQERLAVEARAQAEKQAAVKTATLAGKVAAEEMALKAEKELAANAESRAAAQRRADEEKQAEEEEAALAEKLAAAEAFFEAEQERMAAKASVYEEEEQRAEEAVLAKKLAAAEAAFEVEQERTAAMKEIFAAATRDDDDDLLDDLFDGDSDAWGGDGAHAPVIPALSGSAATEEASDRPSGREDTVEATAVDVAECDDSDDELFEGESDAWNGRETLASVPETLVRLIPAASMGDLMAPIVTRAAPGVNAVGASDAVGASGVAPEVRDSDGDEDLFGNEASSWGREDSLASATMVELSSASSPGAATCDVADAADDDDDGLFDGEPDAWGGDALSVPEEDARPVAAAVRGEPDDPDGGLFDDEEGDPWSVAGENPGGGVCGGGGEVRKAPVVNQHAALVALLAASKFHGVVDLDIPPSIGEDLALRVALFDGLVCAVPPGASPEWFEALAGVLDLWVFGALEGGEEGAGAVAYGIGGSAAEGVDTGVDGGAGWRLHDHVAGGGGAAITVAIDPELAMACSRRATARARPALVSHVSSSSSSAAPDTCAGPPPSVASSAAPSATLSGCAARLCLLLVRARTWAVLLRALRRHPGMRCTSPADEALVADALLAALPTVGASPAPGPAAGAATDAAVGDADGDAVGALGGGAVRLALAEGVGIARCCTLLRHDETWRRGLGGALRCVEGLLAAAEAAGERGASRIWDAEAAVLFILSGGAASVALLSLGPPGGDPLGPPGDLLGLSRLEAATVARVAAACGAGCLRVCVRSLPASGLGAAAEGGSGGVSCAPALESLTVAQVLAASLACAGRAVDGGALLCAAAGVAEALRTHDGALALLEAQLGPHARAGGGAGLSSWFELADLAVANAQVER